MLKRIIKTDPTESNITKGRLGRVFKEDIASSPAESGDRPARLMTKCTIIGNGWIILPMPLRAKVILRRLFEDYVGDYNFTCSATAAGILVWIVPFSSCGRLGL